MPIDNDPPLTYPGELTYTISGGVNPTFHFVPSFFEVPSNTEPALQAYGTLKITTEGQSIEISAQTLIQLNDRIKELERQVEELNKILSSAMRMVERANRIEDIIKESKENDK